MDLKVYYQKIRETAAKYPDKDLVVVSRATGDGGKAGVYTEVPKEIAAVMVVEGTAVVAEPEETAAFRKVRAEQQVRVEREQAAARMPLSVVTAADLQRMFESRNQD